MKGTTERMFIAAALRSGDMLPIVSAGVDPSWFTSHRPEWEWIVKHWRQHRSMPSEALFSSNWARIDIPDAAETDLGFLTDQLKDEFLGEELATSLRSAAARISSGDSSSAILDELRQKTHKLSAAASGDLRHETAFADDWSLALDEVARRHQRRAQGLVGIPLGLKGLDTHTGGPQPGDLYIVGARLGQGKSWLLAKSAAHAVLAGHKVQYDTLEMTRAQMALRSQAIIAQELGVSPHKVASLIQGDVDLIGYEEYCREVADQLPGVLVINDTPRQRVTPDLVAAQIERNRPSVVYIDYLTLMKLGGDQDWRAVAQVSGDLKSVAVEYELPIVAAAQINRSGAMHEMPGAENLAQSDAIGQDADAVIILRQLTRSVIKVRLEKWRHGRDGIEWFCEFKPNVGYIRQVDKDTANDLMDDDKTRGNP